MWKREGFPLSVAMLDLDNFKWINDTFGHQKGDEILKKWGEIIRKELRSSDVPIRYGGEEVLIIFPYTLKEEAAGAIERIREKLQQIDFGIGRKVNFSAGIACYPEDIREACFDDLILIADERLYAAKRSGKGKTVISDEEAEE
jgi:diguanylate cyclase (GGDEF)-like protein